MKLQSYVKNFTCGTGGENSETVYYFVYDSVPINLRQHLPVCNGTFQVPISSTSLEKLLENESGNNELGEVLNEGFEVATFPTVGLVMLARNQGVAAELTLLTTHFFAIAVTNPQIHCSVPIVSMHVLYLVFLVFYFLLSF